MKKINLLLCAVLFAFISIIGCKKQSNTDVESIGINHKSSLLVENGILNLPKNSDGKYVYEGDIILSNEQVEIIINNFKKPSDVKTESTFQMEFTKLWPNGVVYYTIDSNVPEPSRITQAMSEIQNTNSGVTFVARTNQVNYVRFINTSDPNIGGASSLGMIGGLQTIELNNASNAPKGVVMHEILHALGFFHEQSRSDRDNYIKILPQNIANGRLSQFNTYLQNNIAGFEIGTFDFESIMLYGSTAFANSSSVYTMTRLDGSPFWDQRSYLSAQDIEGIKYLYKPIYVKNVRVSDPSSYYNGSGTGEDYMTLDHLYIELYSDNAHTQPLILQKPLKIKMRYFHQQGTFTTGSYDYETILPVGSQGSIYVGDHLEHSVSDYGTVVFYEMEFTGIIPGAGYVLR